MNLATKNLGGFSSLQTESYLVDARESGRLIGVSRSRFLQMDQTGRLGPESVSLGNGTQRQLRRWNRLELLSWINADCPCRTEWGKIRVDAGFGEALKVSAGQER